MRPARIGRLFFWSDVSADAAKAADIVVLAKVRALIEDMRHTKRNDATYTPEMKRGMEDALNCLAQTIELWRADP